MVSWSFPTRIVFGAGAVAGLGEEVARLGVSRVLVVTDPGVLAAGLLDPVERALDAAGVTHARFSGLTGNPTEAQVEAGAVAFREAGAAGVVAVGGGSALDVGKLIAVRSRTALPFEQLDDAKGGDALIPANLPPVIAVPTTAGTGSEVGRAGVLTLTRTHRKIVVFAPSMLPRVALLDPELTVSMPAGITAATGFDALTHNIEAYLAKGDHPLADAIALGGIELALTWLPTAVRQPGDLAARGGMMKSAMMGAIAFQKGLGACHSLAHPLSSQLGLHHGLANALCLPAVLEFNEGAVPERVAVLASRLGAGSEVGAAALAVRRFRREVGLPDGLGAAGVRAEQLAALADEAADDGCHASNPRPCSRDALLALYRASL